MRYITKAFMKTKKHVYIWTYKWKIPMFESIKLYSGWEGLWDMNIRAHKQAKNPQKFQHSLHILCEKLTQNKI